ncbi:MAG: hypothetical protein KDA60_00755 [Planctomycetales bacterium]|nr:hypothetical protein [Planctomycetales bacterium]
MSQLSQAIRIWALFTCALSIQQPRLLFGQVHTSPSILIDNFNDGNDDGWIRLDFTLDEPSGPGIFDASSGAYNLDTTGSVDEGRGGLLTSMWTESIAPQFSNGLLRATIRANESRTVPFLLLRAPPGETDPYYAFGGDVRSGLFFIDNSSEVSVMQAAPGVFREDESWIIEAGAVDENGVTRLTMKVWRPGTTEPTAPQLTVLDVTPLAPHRFGLGAWVPMAGSRTSATFDDVSFRLVVPACDFDYNGACNVDDIDALVSSGDLRTGVPVPPMDERFDLTGDQVVNGADIEMWLWVAASENGLVAPYLRGDANLDGTVNQDDWSVWQESAFKLEGPVSWSSGDFNGDGVADGSDFNLWLKNRNRSSLAQTVPEPSGALAMVVSLLVLSIRWRSIAE